MVAASQKRVSQKRCKNGTRKNRTTGKCESKVLKQKSKQSMVATALKKIPKALSFVPSARTRAHLYKQAKLACCSPELCSKLSTPPVQPSANAPYTVDAQNCILVRIARDGLFGGPKLTGTGPKGHAFAILADRAPPLLFADNNVLVLTAYWCTQRGSRRYNLFVDSDATTKTLLKDYLAFRDKHLKAIFDIQVAAMRGYIDTTSGPVDANYVATTELFETISKTKRCSATRSKWFRSAKHGLGKTLVVDRSFRSRPLTFKRFSYSKKYRRNLRLRTKRQWKLTEKPCSPLVTLKHL